jgi:hypothetical protein
MWMQRSALDLTQGELAHHDLELGGGRKSIARTCARCATRLWSEPARHPGFAVLRPGTLDDTSWLEPVAHVWTRSAQPWFRFPPGVTTHDSQPPKLMELVALWQSRRRL